VHVVVTNAYSFSTTFNFDPNQRHWEASEQLLQSTVPERSRWDHRAKKAQLVGISTQILIAIQPDRACGRKLLFLNATSGTLLGHVLLQVTNSTTSSLRGLLVEHRDCGYSGIFLNTWLLLCNIATVTPETCNINKPLLALALLKAGFLPNNTGILVEISRGENNTVLIYNNGSNQGRLFSETELRSQRLVLTSLQPELPGRAVQIKTRYVYRNNATTLDSTESVKENANHALVGHI
jgi:hypothetical protein